MIGCHDTGTAATSSSAISGRRSVEPPPAREGRWLHLCNGLDPVRDGGMVPSILGMTSALNRQYGGLTIITPTPSRLDGRQVAAGLTLRGPEADLEASIGAAEIVHMHGLWQLHTRRGSRIARAAGVPYLIAAHGMAEPWALRQKRWKKRIYMALVEAKTLRRAACLHALSRPEIDQLRSIAPWAPICYVPNGVELAPFDELPPRSVLESECPEIKDKFVLLFYGRLHAKKGLDLLAEALGAVLPGRPEIHLVIAGNDDGAWAPFHARMAELDLTQRMTYLGHVSGERRAHRLGAADAFVLPSHSEGFSMAVLEALASRLPCLITTACHFPELAAAGGGVEVAPEVNAIIAGLRDLIERSPAERAALGQIGRRLVEAHYTWDRQADTLASVYEWLRAGGCPPEAVFT